MKRAGTLWLLPPLAGWALLAAALTVSGRLDLYLHPLFRPFIGVMAAVLVLMALGLVLLPGEEVGGHGAEPLSRRGALWRAAVLLVPAFLAWGINPQGFGLRTVLNRGILKDARAMASQAGTERHAAAAALASPDAPLVDPIESLPLPGQTRATPPPGAAAADEGLPDFFEFLDQSPDGAWRLEMLDLLMACDMPALRKRLEGLKVELTGQVVTGAPGAVGGQFSLVRLMMVCCAADARPVGVWVERPEGIAGFADMDWVRVVGRPDFPVRQGRRVPVMKAESMEPTRPPDEIFLFQ